MKPDSSATHTMKLSPLPKPTSTFAKMKGLSEDDQSDVGSSASPAMSPRLSEGNSNSTTRKDPFHKDALVSIVPPTIKKSAPKQERRVSISGGSVAGTETSGKTSGSGQLIFRSFILINEMLTHTVKLEESIQNEVKISATPTKSEIDKYQNRFAVIYSILERTMKMSSNPMIVMAPDCTVLMCSPSMKDIFEYDAGQLVGENINMLMNHELAARHDKIVSDYVHRLESGSLENYASPVVNNTRPVTAMNRSGQPVAIEISVRALTDNISAEDGSDETGRVVFFVAQIRDCRQEIALRSTLQEAAMLQEIFPFPYLEATEKMIITRFNPAAETTFGISAERAIGKNVMVLLPRTIHTVKWKKRVGRENHDSIVANFVSKVRSVGEKNVTSSIVNSKTRHRAVRVNYNNPYSLEPESFGLELEVKMSMSHTGDIKFQAFMRDTAGQVQEKIDAVIESQAFPEPIIEEIRAGKEVNGERDLSVIFCDIVGFTSLASMLEDNAVLSTLSEIFKRFRAIKGAIPSFDPIKTNYDEMMATTGLDAEKLVGSHADDAVSAARAMLNALEEYNEVASNSIGIRVGIDSGPVLCGLIGGERNMCFDLIGKVSVGASRAENTGAAGKIHITENTYKLLSASNKAMFVKNTATFKNMGDHTTYLSV